LSRRAGSQPGHTAHGIGPAHSSDDQVIDGALGDDGVRVAIVFP
jgi:hypothetical protein